MKKLLLALGLSCVFWLPAAWSMTAEEIAHISQAADRGNGSAQMLLAIAYLEGEGGLPKDMPKAAHWFEQSALQGNAYAQSRLADLYEAGTGVTLNLKLAADWREKAALRGIVDAQLKLGKMYLEGSGVPKDSEQARNWLEHAAVAGNAEAKYLLSGLYRRNQGADQGKAKNMLSQAAAQGSEEAVRLLHLIEGLGYSVEQAWHERAPDLHRLAEDGDAEAQYQLGLRTEGGLFGETRNPQAAIRWYTLAAENGNTNAMKALEHIYREGAPGAARDPAQARHWAERAARATARP